MANNLGTATIDFGAWPGSNEASITVSDATIITGAKCDAFVMADSTTSDHTASDHKYFTALAGLSAGNVVNTTGFTIYARSMEKLEGTFLVNWVWST